MPAFVCSRTHPARTRERSGPVPVGEQRKEQVMSNANPIVVFVVTGGSAGIGRATVREFARNGYDVAIGREKSIATKRS